MYDPIEKKLIRSRDVVFFEDQTIEDIDKDNKQRSSDDIPTCSDPVPVPLDFDCGGVEIEQREEIDIDNLATDEPGQEAPSTPPPPQDEPKRSTRENRSYSRYNPNKYVLLIQ